MRIASKWPLIIVASAVFITLIILLLIHFTPSPPEDDMLYARQSLSEAARCKAGTYSKKLYIEANAAYDSAMIYWGRENKKFIFFRDFNKVLKYAKLSAKKANQASESSQTNSTSLRVRLKDKIEDLNKTALSIERLFGRYPMTADVRNRISNGKFFLKEGEVAYEKEQFLTANKKITEAEYLLSEVYKNATADLRDYFKSFSTWKKWVQSAINDSRVNECYSIIVDKFSKKLYLYYNGMKKYEFDTELGRNWVGTKRRMGDKATPEGSYRIVNKFQGRQTPYHKSLSLDYPNARDTERFKGEISRGTLPAYAKIGGGIEIHGGGGRGADWTEGCIALTDSEIDVIFKIVQIGTPVTIVGSSKNIDEVLDNYLTKNGN
jgi:hypothetical protein